MPVTTACRRNMVQSSSGGPSFTGHCARGRRQEKSTTVQRCPLPKPMVVRSPRVQMLRSMPISALSVNGRGASNEHPLCMATIPKTALWLAAASLERGGAPVVLQQTGYRQGGRRGEGAPTLQPMPSVTGDNTVLAAEPLVGEERLRNRATLALSSTTPAAADITAPSRAACASKTTALPEAGLGRIRWLAQLELERSWAMMT